MTLADRFMNDVFLLPYYAWFIFFSFVCFFSAIMFHEIGHQLYFKLKLKKNIKVKFFFNNIYSFGWKAGEQADYDVLTDKQYHDVNLFGILTGIIPILLFGIVMPYLLLILIPYITGSWGDIKEMMENAPKEE